MAPFPPGKGGSERAQVLPLLDAVWVWTGKRGRPQKRPNVLVTDEGYDAQDLRQRGRRRGIRPQIPTRVWKRNPPWGDRPSRTSHACKPSAPSPGSRKGIAIWSSVGSVSFGVLRRCLRLP
jgi:hypothetical protein